MSRIGKKPLEIKEGVTVKIEEKSKLGGQNVIVTGPLGNMELPLRKEVFVKVENNIMTLECKKDSDFSHSLHGLYRSLIANMLLGVKDGFYKKLEIVGIGYRAEVKGKDLEITLGATHPYLVPAPEGITFEVTDKVFINIKGKDKQLVGQVASKIRDLSKPEPYKGKGIRYEGEYVRRKAGKAAKGAESAA